MTEVELTPALIQWSNALADELLYGPTSHNSRRHYLLMGVQLAIEAGSKVARNESLPAPKLTVPRGVAVVKKDGPPPFTIDGVPR